MIGVVPIKDPARVKSRLGPGSSRQQLAEAWLDTAIAALRGAGVQRVIAVCDGAGALALALDRGLEPCADPSAGLAAAVDAGLAAAGEGGVVVVLPDLPGVRPADVAALWAAAAAGPAVAIGIDRHGDGVNALAAPVASWLRPTAFGTGESRALTIARARRRGLAVAELHRPGLALDVDVPEDLPRAG
jgi:2-phospho-L-lactate guanylyltransferase